MYSIAASPTPIPPNHYLPPPSLYPVFASSVEWPKSSLQRILTWSDISNKMWWKSAFIGNNFSQLCHIYCSGGGRFSPTRVTLETLKHFAGNFYILITFMEPSNNIMRRGLNEKWKCLPLIFVKPWCTDLWVGMFVRLSLLILFCLCRYQSQATWLCKKPKLAKFATNASGTNWWTWDIVCKKGQYWEILRYCNQSLSFPAGYLFEVEWESRESEFESCLCDILCRHQSPPGVQSAIKEENTKDI